jgi:hypothetical protein
MPSYGTLMLSDLLAQTSGTVAQIGEANVWDAFQRSLAAHNRQMTEMVATFCDFTTERLIGTGGISSGDFEELDELETPRPQKVVPGENLGIPMRATTGTASQWTELYLEEATPADLAGQFVSVMDADKRNIINQINRAIYLSSNYTSIDIRKKDQASLPIKRLANADGFSIPVGPNGETFTAASHTHYIARVGTFASTDLDNLITTTGEHYPGMVRVLDQPGPGDRRSGASRASRRPWTSASSSRPPSYVATPGLDLTNRGDRMIGIYNGAEIWIKPWAIGELPPGLQHRRPQGLLLPDPHRPGRPRRRPSARSTSSGATRSTWKDGAGSLALELRAESVLPSCTWGPPVTRTRPWHKPLRHESM